MSFHAYEGVSDSGLDKQRLTSTGEKYTLRHNEDLKIEMPYLGKDNSKANAQGWERDSKKYFNDLYHNHPEMFSAKNAARIKEGHTPIVDQKMISKNPEWAQYRNQPLVHHHIGGDGEAVAVPQNVHKGQGEIHIQEKNLGITAKCEAFSAKCSEKNDSVGKTTSQLHSELKKDADAKRSESSKTSRSQSFKNSLESSDGKAQNSDNDNVKNNTPQNDKSNGTINNR